MPLIARRRIAASVLALVASLALVGSTATTPSASADQPMPPTVASAQADISVKALPKQGKFAKCIARATDKKAIRKAKKHYWTCAHGHVKRTTGKPPASPLVASPTTPSGKFTDEELAKLKPGDVPGMLKPRGEQAAVESEDPPIQALDADDDWCENMWTCTEMTKPYVGKIKTNVWYGHNTEVLGTFDVVFIQSFNGTSSRYKLRLYHDGGPAVVSSNWQADVKWVKPFAFDPITGTGFFFPEPLSKDKAVVYYPKPASKFENLAPTPHSKKHYDELYGTIEVYGRFYDTTTFSLPDFTCGIRDEVRKCWYPGK